MAVKPVGDRSDFLAFDGAVRTTFVPPQKYIGCISGSHLHIYGSARRVSWLGRRIRSGYWLGKFERLSLSATSWFWPLDESSAVPLHAAIMTSDATLANESGRTRSCICSSIAVRTRSKMSSGANSAKAAICPTVIGRDAIIVAVAISRTTSSGSRRLPPAIRMQPAMIAVSGKCRTNRVQADGRCGAIPRSSWRTRKRSCQVDLGGAGAFNPKRP